MAGSSGLRINTNVPALFAQRLLANTTGDINKSIERLSSGLRINRASDDAAGFAISERLRTQVNGLSQAQRNAQDATSLVQVAEGGLAQVSDILQRLRTLSVQAANDSNTTADRRLIQVEVNALLDEITRQASATTFNNRTLLTGKFAAGATTLFFQVGANQSQRIGVNISSISTGGLGISALRVAVTTTATRGGMITRASAESAITLIQSAVDKASQQRVNLGSIQNRLDNVINFVGISRENITAAESRIRDLDFADEIVKFTKNQILQQTGVSALSQSNISPQVVLALLQ